MNGVLWAVQAALAFVFFLGATVRASRYEFASRQLAWVGAASLALVQVIAVIVHLTRHETVVPNAVLIALAVFVAVARPLASPF